MQESIDVKTNLVGELLRSEFQERTTHFLLYMSDLNEKGLLFERTFYSFKKNQWRKKGTLPQESWLDYDVSLGPQTPHHWLTVHKVLLLLGQDAGQVGTVQPTFPLRSVPRASVCHVLIAVGLKLLPTESTNLRVWKEARMVAGLRRLMGIVCCCCIKLPEWGSVLQSIKV